MTAPTQELDSVLRDGIAAAQAGNKVRAKLLLRQVVTVDKSNQLALLWLANVTDPAEALACLRSVLQLNPSNQHAQQSLPAVLLRAGVDAAQRKDLTTARSLLAETLVKEPKNEHALLWLAGIATNPSEAVGYLKQVLAINPNNERAKQGLAQHVAMNGSWDCPFCERLSRDRHNRCPHCSAVTTLDDPRLFDQPTGASEAAVARSVGRLTPAAQKAPGSREAFLLGLAYLNLGRPAEAIKVFNLAAVQPTADAKWKDGVLRLAAHWRARSQPPAPTTPSEARYILAVDDSATVRKLVTVALQGAGYRVESVADGRQVPEAIHKHGVPRLVLLDINMPGVDGYQVCAQLRQHPATSAVPIIFLTGKDGFFNKMRGKWAGAAEYLTKPFQPKALVEIVNRTLSASPA